MSTSELVSTQVLRAAGVDLDPGLTDREVDAVQDRFRFTFLPEHREFLHRHLPVGDSWPDWRGMPPALQHRLDWPVVGVLFDVAENAFWAGSWGPRPVRSRAALARARELLAGVPRLVPVYSHRYLPAAPVPGPAPVFSVHQTDVIHYGADLEDYLLREFAGSAKRTPPMSARVPFWDDLVEGVDDAIALSPP